MIARKNTSAIFWICIVSLIGAGLCCYDYSRHGKDWGCDQCQHGLRQSPIDINAKFIRSLHEPECAGISFAFHNPDDTVTVNNGNTFQTNVDFSQIALIDIENHHGHYNVTQFHFHSPSEHTIDGEKLDLEIHIVAKRVDGDSQGLTVLGIFFQKTDNPEEEAELFREYEFPGEEEGASIHNTHMDFKKIFNHVLEDNQLAYRYKGSLTTGSCAEDVNWFVFAEPLKITTEKYEKFHRQWSGRDMMPYGNNREVQKLNGRKVELVKLCSSFIHF